MANLPLAFAEVLIGGILATAGVTGDSFSNIIKGDITKIPLAGSSGSSSVPTGVASGTGAGAGAGSSPSLGSSTGKVTGSVTGLSALLSSTQQTFAKRLAADTGLNVDVIAAWMHNEEPNMLSNAPRGADNWLNVGITDTASYGENNPVWGNPLTAADATAAWMHGVGIGSGGYSSTSYPGAASTIQDILATAGQSAESQIKAIQGSGWASGGESALANIYNQLAGS